MALQLGFNDSVKLLDSDDASIRQVLALTADKYRQYALDVDVGESDRATYWRIQFAILSVHSPIDATFEAYKAIRLFRARFGRLPSERVLANLLLRSRGIDGVVQYAYTKGKYLREFDKAFTHNPSAFTRNGSSDIEWRNRIQASVKGLGIAKASFAVALSAPSTSDVCCIDTHIYALFYGHPPRKSVGKRVYLALEEKVRAYAKEFKLSVFACQWALWDAKRGISNPHSALSTV